MKTQISAAGIAAAIGFACMGPAVAGPQDPTSYAPVPKLSVLRVVDSEPSRGSAAQPYLPGAERTVPVEEGLLDPLLGKTSSVIGPDGRVRITATTTYPYRAIAQILFGDGYLCTGWLIGPNTLITAGHCVHSGGASGSWYDPKSYAIYRGRNVSSAPYGKCTATNLYSVKGWTEQGSSDYDYGAIKLSCPSYNVGYFGFANRSTVVGLKVSITGYPGDKASGTLWSMGGTIAKSTDRSVGYTIDTAGGQSGSGVIEMRAGQYYGVGIHAYGASNGFNSGTRINAAVYKNLASWKKLP